MSGTCWAAAGRSWRRPATTPTAWPTSTPSSTAAGPPDGRLKRPAGAGRCCGLVRVLGDDNVTHICTDDYHRYIDRRQRAERNITPLHPECNYIDIIGQHLQLLRAGEPILKPVYRHSDGTFGAPVYVEPAQFTLVEGLFGFHTAAMCVLTTCASTSTRRSCCGAAGRCAATARGAATPPTRCWRSSTGASTTRRRTSGHSGATSDSRRSPASPWCSLCTCTASTGDPPRVCAPAAGGAPRLSPGACRTAALLALGVEALLYSGDRMTLMPARRHDFARRAPHPAGPQAGASGLRSAAR